MPYEIRAFTNIAAAIEANEALGREHYEEIALNKRVMVYAPDIEKYKSMEEHGALLSLGAFDGKKIVGYSVNFIYNHPHYKDMLVAHNDMIFVAKDNRLGTLGLKLIKATTAACRERGAHMMMWHAKPNTRLAELFPKLGCGVQDLIFSEVL
ncbi:putative GNAT superfamily acetyltransferase [Oxalobacteraceae bacterium GrIS 2.11]